MGEISFGRGVVHRHSFVTQTKSVIGHFREKMIISFSFFVLFFDIMRRSS